MERDRRIVLKTLTGPRAGIRAIQGTESQLLAGTNVNALPQIVECVDFLTHTAPAALIEQRNTYVLYCETIPTIPTIPTTPPDDDDDGA